MATDQTTQTAPPSNRSSRPDPIDGRSLNLPNLITTSRLLLSLVLFELIYLDGLWLTSAALFVFAASTDFLDGYVARKYGQVTTLGRILDPFVDKIIVGGSFIFLINKQTVIDGQVLGSGVTAWMTLIVIGREMFVSSLRGFLETEGLDFSADWVGKSKMALQCVAVTVSLLSMSEHVVSPGFIQVRDIILWTTVIVTAYSGLAYIFRAIKLLRAPVRVD